jgi:hypothetical protein
MYNCVKFKIKHVILIPLWNLHMLREHTQQLCATTNKNVRVCSTLEWKQNHFLYYLHDPKPMRGIPNRPHMQNTNI